jgi:hypothetical protein
MSHRAVSGQQLLHDIQIQAILTAIASLTSCGKLEPCTAAAAEEAKRVDTPYARGARSEAHTLLEAIRKAIVYAGYLANEKDAQKKSQ